MLTSHELQDAVGLGCGLLGGSPGLLIPPSQLTPLKLCCSVISTLPGAFSFPFLSFLNSSNESTAYPVLKALVTFSFQTPGTSKCSVNNTFFLSDAQTQVSNLFNRFFHELGPYSSGDHLAYL